MNGTLGLQFLPGVLQGPVHVLVLVDKLLAFVDVLALKKVVKV